LCVCVYVCGWPSSVPPSIHPPAQTILNANPLSTYAPPVDGREDFVVRCSGGGGGGGSGSRSSGSGAGGGVGTCACACCGGGGGCRREIGADLIVVGGGLVVVVGKVGRGAVSVQRIQIHTHPSIHATTTTTTHPPTYLLNQRHRRAALLLNTEPFQLLH
jgi:hypothetical protein